MPAYKRQHYLPTVYLREFTPDPGDLSRTSQVWRSNGRICVPVTVESQCVENYHYSQEHPETAEKMFAEIEGLYAKCIRAIKSGQDPTVEMFYGLIMMIFDLHIRNAAYENATGKENIHAYNRRLHGLKMILLPGRPSGAITDKEVAKELKARWRVRILKSSEGGELITSDNPSAWIGSHGKSPQLGFALLPITPTHMAVAFDKTLVQMEGERMMPQDDILLNQLQCRVANSAVYSRTVLDNEQLKFIAKRLKNSRKLPARTTDTGWDAAMWRLPPNRQLSFLRSAPPLM